MQPGLLGETFLGYAGKLEVRPNAIDGVDDHARQKTTSECVFQAKNHIQMGIGIAMRRRMAKTPEQRRELLRSFMQERGLKPARWAKEAGVSANSLYNFLNGHSEGLELITYAKLARTQGVPVWRISGDSPEPRSPTSVWVVGAVEAGMFREAIEWDESRWYPVDVPVPDRFRRVAKALEVVGPSMNLEYPERSIVIWVDVLDARPPRDGDHVIAYRVSYDGAIEATVKELKVVDGKRWLWPRSSDPQYQAPIDVENPGDGVESIEIRGLVLGGYKPRVL